MDTVIDQVHRRASILGPLLWGSSLPTTGNEGYEGIEYFSSYYEEKKFFSSYYEEKNFFSSYYEEKIERGAMTSLLLCGVACFTCDPKCDLFIPEA